MAKKKTPVLNSDGKTLEQVIDEMNTAIAACATHPALPKRVKTKLFGAFTTLKQRMEARGVVIDDVAP